MNTDIEIIEVDGVEYAIGSKEYVNYLQDEIERLRSQVAELTEDNNSLYNECEDAIVRAEKAEAEIERLRRAETPARELIDAYPFSLPAHTPYSTKWAALKAALDEFLDNGVVDEYM